MLTNAASATTRHIEYLDVLRVLAALFVVAIHVLGPYRTEIGQIPLSDWSVAVGLNSASRWVVPVFIMISGVLLLSSSHRFTFQHFIQRRVMKVVVPFVLWSLLFAGLSGLTAEGFSWQTVAQTLHAAPDHETYYHLGFFLLLHPVVALDPNTASHTRAHTNMGSGGRRTRMDGPDRLVFIGRTRLVASRLYSLWRLFVARLLVTSFPTRTASLVGPRATRRGNDRIPCTWYQYPISALHHGGWLSYTTINTVLISAAVFFGRSAMATGTNYAIMGGHAKPL